MEEIALPNNSVLRIRRAEDGSGRVIVEADRDGVTLRSVPFEASDSRPSDFPDDLPFLPRAAGTLSQAGEKHARTMVWPSAPEPVAGFASLRAEITKLGWEEVGVSEEVSEDGDIQSVDFSRGEALRSLFLQKVGNRAQLMVVDHPPKDD